MPAQRPPLRAARRRAGLSLVEVLVSLAITAALLTAVTLALDASFTAYASAAQSTSAQTGTRMVVHRVQRLIRSGVAQGPLTRAHAEEFKTLQLITPNNNDENDEGDDANENGNDDAQRQSTRTLAVPPALQAGSVDTLISSDWMILDDPAGGLIILDYDGEEQVLYLLASGTGDDAERWTRRPLLRGVTACSFTLLRRNDRQSNYETVLLRGGVDLTVQPGADSTLGTEAGNAPPIRLVASTSPRRLR